MNIPRKHHYLPRVHLKQFKTPRGYTLYLKDAKKFLTEKSENFFFIKDLNSTVDVHGDPDHVSLEKDLADKWDSPFNTYFKAFQDTIELNVDISQECLKYFFEYGIMGYMRRYKAEQAFNNQAFDFTETFYEINDAIISRLNSMDSKGYSTEQIAEAQLHFKLVWDTVKSLEERQHHAKFKGLMSADAELFVPKKCSYHLFIAQEASFILPDCTSIIIASEEATSTQEFGYTKIASVGIPLTPFHFLQINNCSVMSNISNCVSVASPEQVSEINLQSYVRAFDQVLAIHQDVILEFTKTDVTI